MTAWVNNNNNNNNRNNNTTKNSYILMPFVFLFFLLSSFVFNIYIKYLCNDLRTNIDVDNRKVLVGLYLVINVVAQPKF